MPDAISASVGWKILASLVFSEQVIVDGVSHSLNRSDSTTLSLRTNLFHAANDPIRDRVTDRQSLNTETGQ